MDTTKELAVAPGSTAQVRPPGEQHFSTPANELFSALAKAQAVMHGASKTRQNPFFKNKYADLSSVVDAIRGPLSDNGLCWSQITLPDHKAAVVRTVLGHSSGQWIASTTRVPVGKADAQGFGSALTYCRRYGLAALVGIAQEDDDGSAASRSHGQRSEQRNPPRRQAQAQIQAPTKQPERAGKVPQQADQEDLALELASARKTAQAACGALKEAMVLPRDKDELERIRTRYREADGDIQALLDLAVWAGRRREEVQSVTSQSFRGPA